MQHSLVLIPSNVYSIDGSWFTRISYADGLSTIIPYAPIRSDSGQEQAVYYLGLRGQ